MTRASSKYIYYLYVATGLCFFFVENALSLCVNMNILLFSVWETPDCKVFALEEINFSTKCLCEPRTKQISDLDKSLTAGSDISAHFFQGKIISCTKYNFPSRAVNL